MRGYAMARPFDEYVRRITAAGDAGGDGLSFRLPRKLYRVSEIAQHLGLTRQTVHNYATIGLITEDARTQGGQRLFGESVFERLMFVQRMKHTHRLHEIRRLLDSGDITSATPALPSAAELPSDLAAANRRIERSQEIVSVVHRDVSPSLPPAAETPSTRPHAKPDCVSETDEHRNV